MNHLHCQNGFPLSILPRCCSIVGERLPPHVVYRGINLDVAWTQGGPDRILDMSCHYRDDGESYFQQLVPGNNCSLCKTQVRKWSISSLCSRSLLTRGCAVVEARKYNIILYQLPPNTTHLLQPFDVIVFGSVKKTWTNKVAVTSRTDSGAITRPFL